MKKYLMNLLVIAAMMLLPGVMVAQSGITITGTQPFTEGFESTNGSTYNAAGVVPTGWSAFSNGTNSSYVPHVTGSGSYHYPKTGSKCLTFTSGSATYGSTKHVLLPEFTNALSTLQISFWMKTESTSGVLTVGYVTGNDTTTFTAVQSVSASSLTTNANGGTVVEVDLSQVPSTATRLALRWSYASSFYSCGVDDVEVSLIPDCPKVSAAALSSVSDNSATFHWGENGTATSWTVDYDTVYPFTTGVMSSTANDTVITLTNLLSNTTYYATITPSCSGIAGVRQFEFKTACAPVASTDLPYTYGFEDATASSSAAQINACWTRVRQGSTTAYPYPSSSYKHTGTYGLYIYNTSTIKSWIVLPGFEDNLTQLQLSFWAYKSSASYGHLYVGVMSDINNLATFDTIAAINVGATSTWEYFEVPLSGYTGNGTHLVIAGINAATNYTYIDDITVDYLPNCVAPTSLAATNISTNSVDLGWDAGSAFSWIIEYGQTGFTPGNGTTVEVYNNSYTLSGLSSGTNYDVYVKSVCGTDTSSMASLQFATACGFIDIPYDNSFEAYAGGSTAQFPLCFHRINDASGTINYYPYVGTTASSAHTGSKYMYFYSSTSTTYANNEYMVLPAVDTDSYAMNTLEVSFFARYTSGASNLVVGVMTDPADASTFTAVQTVNISTTTYQLYTISLSGYTGYGSYIAVKQPRHTSTSYIYLDDIQVVQASSCPTPLNVRATGVTDETISVAWSDTASIGSYLAYIGRPGFSIDTAVAESVNDTTCTFTGLAANTQYEVIVVADCSSELSNGTYPISVRTACAAFPADSLPYVEDFESYGTGSTATIDPCWTKGTNSATAYPYPYGTTPVTGTRSLYFYSTATYYSYAAMPAFESDLDQLRVRFNFKNYSSLSATYGSYIQVGVMSNPNDISTFVPVQVFTFPGEGSNAVVACELMLDQYTGNGQYIAFRAPITTGLGFSYNYVKIDDVVVDSIPSCRRSTNLVAGNVTSSSADLSWVNNSPDGVSSYTVAYSTQADFNPDSASLTATAYDTTYSLSGLTAYTTYYYRVKANCSADAEWSDKCRFTTLFDCGNGDVENVLDTLGNGTTASYMYMMYNSIVYPRGYSASIYTAEELIGMGLYTNSRINSISLHCGTTAGTSTGVSIYMKETDMDEFSSTVAADTAAAFAGMTLVYQGSIVGSVSQWVEIALDTVFEYHGSQNLLIRFVRDDEPTASTTFYYTSQSPAYRTAYGYSSSATGNMSATRSNNRADMAFNICTDVPSCERPTNVRLDAISDNMAQLRWTGSETATYEYLFSTSSQLDSTATPLSVVGDSIVLTGLTSNTDYYFWARQVCVGGANSDWSVPFHFTTACAPFQLPYFEGFESYASGSTNAIDPCWTKHVSGSATNYPYPYTTAGINSTIGLYFYSYTPSSATTARVSSWAALPLFNAATDSLELRFDMKRYNSTTTYYTTEMYVGVMVDPDDISTFDTVAYFNMKTATPGEIRSFEVDFSNYHGRGRHIAFLAAPPTVPAGSTYAYNYAYLDNVEVARLSSCRRPIDVTVLDSTITTTSAEVTWTDRVANPMGYEVAFAPAGTSIDQAYILPLNASPAQLTGLMPSTHYAVYVRDICGVGDTSDWSAATYFYTSCGGTTQFPVTYTMEDYATGSTATFPYCWTRINDASGTTNYYPYVQSSATYSHSGTNNLYFYSSTTSTYADTMVAVLPEVDASVPASSLEVSFYARTMNATYANSTIKVGIMSNPNDPSTFVQSAAIQLTPTHEFYVVDLVGNSSNGHYIAFMMTRGTSAQYAYIDDITIDHGSPCPRAYDLTCTAVGPNSATLSWSDTASATGYAVSYWADNNPTIVTTLSAANTSLVLNGLTPATSYTFNVRAICLTGDSALASRTPGHFATTQIPATLPYTYDFESAAEWANWQTSSNNNVTWYRGTANAGQGQYSMYVSADSGLTQSTNMAAIVNAVAYRDIDFGTTPSSFTLTFKASVGGTTDANYDGVSVLLVDPAIYVESSATGLTSPWGNVNDLAIRTIRRDSNWATYQVHFDNISGIQRVAFYWFNQSTGATHPFEFGPAAIDSINVAEMTCIRPYGLYADNLGPNSATLRWTGDANANYTVTYREYPGDPTLNQTATATSNSLTLTTLASNTQYVFWVARNCAANNESPVSDGALFTTVCAVYSASDTIREDFSTTAGSAYNVAGVLPDCWVGLSDGTDAKYIPHVVNSGTYWYAHDTNAVIMTSGSTATYGPNKILRMPYTAEPVNSLTLSYWMCTESSSQGTLYVGYMVGDDISDFVAVKTIPASTATLHTGTGNMAAGVGFYDTVSFEGVPDNAQYVAFKWYQNATFYSVCLDDIELTSSNSCAAPAAVASNVDHESADITWAGSGISYELQVAVHGESWPATYITTTTPSYHVTGLYPETEYDFRVRQICDTASVSFWSEGTFTTTDLPCFVPTSLLAGNVTVNAVTLSWNNDPQSHPAAWVVNVFNATTNLMDTVTASPATITGLYDNTQYSVAVKSLCSTMISSDWSDTISFTTASCYAVSNVQVGNITSEGATVTWNAGADETAWEINYGEMDFVQGQGTLVTVTSRSYQITGLEADSRYDVYVRAKCADGVASDWSPVQHFTTLDGGGQGIDGVDGNYSLSIYPNPTAGNTTISLRGVEGEVTITVVDMNGRTISSDVLNCGSDCVKTMNVEGLAQGTYFVRVLGDGINSVRKLIVR